MAVKIDGALGLEVPANATGNFVPRANEIVKQFSAGATLPTSDIGPIWHDAYAAIMTWRTIGTYTGYASLNIGQVAFFDTATPPTGWIKSAGQTISEVYAALIAFRGTNVLRDFRGEFIRGWDDGRGIDTGRTFGSAQSATRVYNGSQDSGGWGGRQIDANLGAGLDFDSAETVALGTTSTISYNPNGPAISNPSQNRIRVRPRNIALLPCIKF